MPKRTLIDDTIGWVNYVQETGIKKQTVAIDWQAEYQKKDEMYKELARIVAKHNCDYHSLKAKFLRMRKECGAEKKRADEAEKHLRIIKKSLTLWQEYYIAEGCETELELTKDILKIIEMLELIEVEEHEGNR